MVLWFHFLIVLSGNNVSIPWEYIFPNSFLKFCRCLDETGWDIQQATYVFTELNKQGTIPAEAFIKWMVIYFIWKLCKDAQRNTFQYQRLHHCNSGKIWSKLWYMSLLYHCGHGDEHNLRMRSCCECVKWSSDEHWDTFLNVAL